MSIYNGSWKTKILENLFHVPHPHLFYPNELVHNQQAWFFKSYIIIVKLFSKRKWFLEHLTVFRYHYETDNDGNCVDELVYGISEWDFTLNLYINAMAAFWWKKIVILKKILCTLSRSGLVQTHHYHFLYFEMKQIEVVFRRYSSK